MVPAYNVLLTSDLFHFFHEFLLEDGVDRLDGDGRSHLRHGEDIDDGDGVVVNDLTDHQAHDFERHTRTTMLHHLEERERGDVDLLCGIVLFHVDAGLRSLTASHALHSHQCS